MGVRGTLLQNVSASLLSSRAMPDRNRKPNDGGPEFEVAYYTKELGRSLQREMLRQQLARLSGNGNSAAHPGEDAAPAADPAAPQEDGAG